MIRLRTPASAAVVEIEVSGKVTRADVEAVFAEIDAAVAAGHDRLKILEDIHDLEGVEPAAMWRDLQLGLPMMKRVSHAAVVTDARWLRALSEVTGPFTPAQVKTFPRDEIAAARAWLAAP